MAESYTVASFAAPLSRRGPGLLLRDLTRGEDPQIQAIVNEILSVQPDILVLTDFDYDLDGVAMNAFAALIGNYPYQFAARPNAGLPTGFDADGNGRLGEARDAQGYGEFAGDGGIAILSRFPIGDVTDLTALLWKDMPGAVLPPMSELQRDSQRLSSTNHLIVPIELPDGALNLLAFAATPPVFDGPEDRNGLRNRDELRLWTHVLNGAFGPSPASFVVAGNANLDPYAGNGHRDAMVQFLADPRLQDPLPQQATAYWSSRPELGPLRVSYVLPAAEWVVMDAGVTPSIGSQHNHPMPAGPHALVWVKIRGHPS
ncbi:endonuclease/exonuclease/phosphatase family protein [Loktanella sp. S4079]|uniref:endonuclease/exonuclease/phosphatase family protein n=1 Tax=Loktanella sp. S4079 TaxID=579483 RepID=UPI000A669F0C|nr:endonuclease/exonuclease/phosphatase family protein [Loktanella sp. S4079]